MSSKHDLSAILMRHVGRDNGITAKQLALQLGVLERQVRTFVTDLRMDGIAICGVPGDGYYVAATAEELELTAQFLRTRAMHSLVLESRLRNVALAELLGQLRVPT